jgi:phage terminase Nu1 subunit (DNA packaging protein)
MAKSQKMPLLRWTLNRAAREFGLSEQMIKSRLKKARILPDADGTWSTHQLVEALFDEATRGRARLYMAQAQRIETLNLARNGELYSAKDIAAHLTMVGQQLKRLLLGLDAPEEQLAEVFQALSAFSIAHLPKAKISQRDRKTA